MIIRNPAIGYKELEVWTDRTLNWQLFQFSLEISNRYREILNNSIKLIFKPINAIFTFPVIFKTRHTSFLFLNILPMDRMLSALSELLHQSVLLNIEFRVIVDNGEFECTNSFASVCYCQLL